MRKILIIVSLLFIISVMTILFMVSKSIKRVAEQKNINEESIINLELKCEEYNITTEERSTGSS